MKKSSKKQESQPCDGCGKPIPSKEVLFCPKCDLPKCDDCMAGINCVCFACENGENDDEEDTDRAIGASPEGRKGDG